MMTNRIQNTYIAEKRKIYHFSFDNFTQMNNYGKNWSFFNIYRFGRKPFSGPYDIYQHQHLQVANAIYEDGLMYRGYASKDTITLVLIIDKHGSLTANGKPLKHGEILIIDDKKYEISFSHYVQIGTVTMTKEFVNEYFPYLYHKINRVYTDSNNALSDQVRSIINLKENQDTYMKLRVIKSIESLSLDKQEEIQKKLSRKEALIFSIRNYILENLEENIDIQDLTLKFGISDKTLQSAFKKFLGYTPKKFIKLLKLNLAYRDIVTNNGTKGIVSKTAIKYGFNNFGLFSREYKRMYGVLPSETGRGSR